MSASQNKPLDTMLAETRVDGWRALAWCAAALMLGGAVWASVSKLDRVAVAQGAVAPKGQVRTVQHLEGGIAREILVREGDRVAKGQTLLQIQLGDDGLNLDEIQVRADALSLERARLRAEVAFVDLGLPEEVAERQPGLAEAEREAYRSRKRDYESSLSVLEDQKAQKELAVRSIRARLKAARERLKPIQAEHEIKETLVAQNLAPRSQALSLERERREVEGEIAALEIDFPLAQAALAEARERARHERSRFRRSAAERLREVEIDLARQDELLGRARRKRERAEVTSPIAGVVKTLHVNTLGAVVAAGAPIVEIVPTEEALIVEALLSPQDIGHVRVGQAAKVKISTYDYLRYGAIEGVIEQISADAAETPEGGRAFRLIVGLPSDALVVEGARYPLSPGMVAEIDVKLGERSVLEALVEPVLKLRAEAFRDG